MTRIYGHLLTSSPCCLKSARLYQCIGSESNNNHVRTRCEYEIVNRLHARQCSNNGTGIFSWTTVKYVHNVEMLFSFKKVEFKLNTRINWTLDHPTTIGIWSIARWIIGWLNSARLAAIVLETRQIDVRCWNWTKVACAFRRLKLFAFTRTIEFIAEITAIVDTVAMRLFRYTATVEAEKRAYNQQE